MSKQPKQTRQGLKDYDVSYEIRSMMDGGRTVVKSATIVVKAATPAEARIALRNWVLDKDTYYDDRIEPALIITHVELVD